jgi:hypothetical protein
VRQREHGGAVLVRWIELNEGRVCGEIEDGVVFGGVDIGMVMNLNLKWQLQRWRWRRMPVKLCRQPAQFVKKEKEKVNKTKLR